MRHRLRQGLREGAVAVVDVEVVVTLKIVGDVEIGATVAVQIARDYSQAVAIHASLGDASCFAYIREAIAIVPVKAITGSWIPFRPVGARADFPRPGALILTRYMSRSPSLS